MEAVPRLPMICFDLKVSPDRQPSDFGKLKQYIRDFYHEDPESYAGEVHKLEALRATALRPALDVTGCSVLKKYYCQLHFLQSRFPMGKDGAAAINFTWRDTYANMVCTLADIRFEIVSVLYNIGALHSQLGASDSRSTSEGLKLACTHFQCAAWAFQHLKDTYPQPAGVDLAPDLMQFMNQVCLAQAQECILEKSMTDNRKATINAKVAAQIVDYYNLALNALSHGGTDDGSVMETVGSKLFKSWKRYVKFKTTYYGCIALLYQGQQSEEQQKMGERMAYYQAAFDKLVETSKLTKGLDHPEVIEEALTFTLDVVEGKRKAAKNENEFIYHEEVPDKDALPEIKGAALVKGIPFSVTDPDIAGPDIFGRLVPMKAHEASSLYSEEKAKLLRRIGGMIDEKDQELVAFMSSLQLDCVNAHTEPNRLPQDIVDRCAALSAKPDAIQNLIASMDKLSDIYQDVEAMLKEIMELIQYEEVEEKEYQEVMGSRPPSIVATDLTREAKKYEEAHNKAAESNNTLHKAMTQHIANLRLLELPLPQLSAQIPSVSALNLDQQPVVKEMQHLVGKVEEMRRQRAMLATQLRESVCSDDITAQLVTRASDNLETVFQEELQKHVKYVSLIEQNLSAQENIVKAMTETYAQYATVRKATMEIIRQRNLTLSALMSSYDAYEDLIAKSNKGQEFYRKLETNVTKLHQRVKGTCKVQQEERDTILAKNCKTLPSKKKVMPTDVNTNVPPPTGTGGPKLKDYLDNYKREKAGGYSTQNSGGQVNDPYYSAGNFPSSKPVGGVPSFPSDSVTAPYDSSQPWIPSVRPAPVGQEGTCPTTSSQDLKPEQNFSGGYASTYPQNPGKPYSSSDGMQYPQSYPAQYASYTNQYQYPTSPYHMPNNYAKNDPAAYGKAAANHMSYPQSPQLSGSTQETTAKYPVPTPSPVLQNYPPPPPYEAYKVPTTMAQGYVPPTTMAQGYVPPTTVAQGYVPPTTMAQGYVPPTTIGQGFATPTTITHGYAAHTLPYNATPQYPSQAYQTPQAQNLNYPLPAIQNATQPVHQQVLPQYPAGSSQTYPAQGVPPVQNYSSTSTSPQHTQSTTNTTQVSNYQVPGGNQSAYPYQNLASSYSQTAISQPQQQGSNTSVDQKISTNFNALQNKQTEGTTYSTQNYPMTNQSQEKSQESNQQPYQSALHSQYQNYTSGSYSYTTPGVSQGVTQSSVAQPQNTIQQYSSYIPQMYTAYINNQQYTDNKNHTGVEPWQSAYDTKNPQGTPNYYPANQYPNYSQMGSEMQYTPATAASYYTHAGQVSSQTSASIPQPTNPVISQPNYTQGNYYQLPYGYQYTSVSTQTITSPTSAPSVYPTQVSTQQGQMTPQSPMTYMQASNSNLKLTFSQDKSSSNVDLLAGLDFSLSQDPLVPQQKEAKTPAKTVQEPVFTGVEDKLAAVTLSETTVAPAPPAVAPTDPAPEQVNGTPKKNAESIKFQLKDPFNDSETLNQFVQEVEKFEKFVEGLTVKSLNGLTPLDIKWKELLDLQEREAVKHSISVARCYPVKNRFPDILPYDNSRVELPSTKDDYINASYVKDVTSNFPDFIVTQLPLPSTFGDFWTMVLEQQVELIVCLLNDSEVEGSQYWPSEKGVEMVVGRVKLNLQSCNSCKHWVERIIHVADSRLSRVVVHLQFTEWPGSLFPSSPRPFLALVLEMLSVRVQQRGGGPCVVHCLAGVGRAGLFLLTAAAICHTLASRTLPDLTVLAANISTYRKNALRDREHFKFAFQTLLYYSQDLLMKRGILASRSSFEDKRTKSHTRHPSEDFLLGPPKDKEVSQSSPEKKEDGSTSESASAESVDPLSQLDPLWSINRLN